MVTKEFKEKEIERILPFIWNSYQHMYDVRKTNLQNKISLLMMIISFLSALSLGLFVYFQNKIFVVAMVIQMISFIFLFKSLFLRKGFVPWFKSDETLKDIEDRKFNKKLFATLKSLEDNTFIEMTSILKITNLSLLLISFSVYVLLLGLISVFFYGDIVAILFLLLTISCILIFGIYYKKNPEFDYEKKSEDYLNQIDGWLNKD